ncbi:DUF488 family protein [Brenneria populi]|uniref:DUF488 family protein n=1 Tax=Brenneria populi TaxID=1505588 RepID=A0ABU6JNM7_9GAMM|nr:DUF488 family protein [Brenneria populi Li et al. 2015]
MLNCKRVYEAAQAEDGYRVLVDRLWPRGMAKASLAMDEWNKTLAPSAELRRRFHHGELDFAAFSARYREELAAQPEAWRPLLARARRQRITLLYAARDVQHNHAQVLAAFLRGQAA